MKRKDQPLICVGSVQVFPRSSLMDCETRGSWLPVAKESPKTSTPLSVRRLCLQANKSLGWHFQASSSGDHTLRAHAYVWFSRNAWAKKGPLILALRFVLSSQDSFFDLAQLGRPRSRQTRSYRSKKVLFKRGRIVNLPHFSIFFSSRSDGKIINASLVCNGSWQRRPGRTRAGLARAAVGVLPSANCTQTDRQTDTLTAETAEKMKPWTSCSVGREICIGKKSLYLDAGQ